MPKGTRSIVVPMRMRALLRGQPLCGGGRQVAPVGLARSVTLLDIGSAGRGAIDAFHKYIGLLDFCHCRICYAFTGYVRQRWTCPSKMNLLVEVSLIRALVSLCT
jgi:hypothetical protein